ncbi:hypothetical protein PRZ48_011014 [Zasmidium cellare]|uniref:Peptidase M14 domain-containing protein n=1 Tax=Zasmidium cellare TaxID=395010 RepID=A0ABR0EAT7_ZASCE|nr:hypothetical protein PRZ48_011014 [Zasmidium cellare]
MLGLRFLALLPLALGSLIAQDEYVSYDGHRVYRVESNGEADAVLNKLSALSYQRWNYCSDEHIDISLSPDEAEEFEKLGLKYSVMHQDLGADIIAESAGSSVKYTKRQNGALPSDSWFDSYHAYADHVQYWKDLNAAFPKNSQYFVAGKSYEKRDIFGLKLYGNSTGDKPAIIWHGNVHAREWITSMTVEYITYNLIKGYKGGDATFTAFLDAYDFYILPFVNPDGFVFSQTKNRLWRKNRSPGPIVGQLGLCYGTDVNRNWPYQWIGDPRGSSPNPCDETYRGRSAGDTPENKALVAQMNATAAKQPIALYVDWHSYGQYILSPYGYTATVPANSADQISLGNEAADAIRAVYGTNFTVGPSGATLYPTTGSSADFATDVAGAEYAYAFELRDQGDNGFVLPPDQIRPTGEEMLAGIKVFLAGL